MGGCRQDGEQNRHIVLPGEITAKQRLGYEGRVSAISEVHP
jgi:hypothetical protein